MSTLAIAELQATAPKDDTSLPGHKQTEIGILPQDWDVTALDQLTVLLTNGFVGKATNYYTERDDSVIYIQGYNVLENGFNLHGVKRVTKEFHARHQKSCLRLGDLLTIQTGDIGVTTVVPVELAGANCHALVISRLDPTRAVPDFYCQYFNSERGRSGFTAIETGSTMKHLNVGDMEKLVLPSPPIGEQRAIATALSGIDELIGALGKLIAKKRAIKLATAQQLLSGSLRLPGFGRAPRDYTLTKSGAIPTDWDVVPLGELFSFKNGLNKDKKHFGSGTPIVNYMDVYTRPFLRADDLRGRVNLTPGEIANFSVQKGDVFFTRTSETVAEIGMASVMLDEPKDTVFSGFVLRARPKNARVTDEYKKYCFSTVEFRKQIVTKSTYTTRALTNGRLLSAVSLPLPSLQEQQAIADAISRMELEIAALERCRDKIKAIKQGMMQVLLTGRIRLVKPGAPE